MTCDPDRPPSDENVRVMDDGQRVSFARIGRIRYADWCEDELFYIQIQSTDEAYVQAAAQGLRVRNVSLSD